MPKRKRTSGTSRRSTSGGRSKSTAGSRRRQTSTGRRTGSRPSTSGRYRVGTSSGTTEVHPSGQHLPETGPKEQQKYEDIKESAQEEGRYPGRAKEVAARTVMKYHGEHEHQPGE